MTAKHFIIFNNEQMVQSKGYHRSVTKFVEMTLNDSWV